MTPCCRDKILQEREDDRIINQILHEAYMRKRRNKSRPLVGLRYTFLHRVFNNKPKAAPKDWKIKAYYHDPATKIPWLKTSSDSLQNDTKIKSIPALPPTSIPIKDMVVHTSTCMLKRLLTALALLIVLTPDTPVPLLKLKTTPPPEARPPLRSRKSTDAIYKHSYPYSHLRTLHGKKKQVKGMTLQIPIDPGECPAHTVHRLW